MLGQVDRATCLIYVIQERIILDEWPFLGDNDLVVIFDTILSEAINGGAYGHRL